MAKKKPLRVVVGIVFFDSSPTVSYNINVWRGDKIAYRLHSAGTWDVALMEMIKDWESLGWVVEATRYKGGVWTGPKPWSWFNRFKKAMETYEQVHR